jgi:flagellar hook-length control protein FliK
MNALPSLLASATPKAAAPVAAASRAAAREADAPRGFAHALGAARGQAPRTEADRAAKVRDAADGTSPASEGKLSEDAAAAEARDPGVDTAQERDAPTGARDDAAVAGTPAAAGTDTRPRPARALLPGATALSTAADTGTEAANGRDDAAPGTGPAVAALAIDSRGDSLRGLRNAATAAGRAASGAATADRAATGGTDTPAARFADALAAASTALASPTAPSGATARVVELLPAAALPASALAGAAAPAPTAPPPAPAEAALPSPPGSPAFAGELSAQLTTFVRHGVEQARLHLNPADMGPVEVRIHLDGDAARVMMSADLAPTRQWLEQALPTLAATLRDAGLTLAGGGVFEQARGGQGQGDAPGQSGRSRAGDSAAPDTITAQPTAVPVRRRGVVDLVA